MYGVESFIFSTYLPVYRSFISYIADPSRHVNDMEKHGGKSVQGILDCLPSKVYFFR